ncbi:hypothetical protein JXO59_15010 [candidate division KSB1 bacterium]|nr:hypothetical protein [candidate division KSB1 bacterium]
MDCEKILKEVCDELAEDINSELCERIRNHLKECPHCEQQLMAMRNTVNLFHCLSNEAVPSYIHDRLAKLLNVNLQQNEKR